MGWITAIHKYDSHTWELHPLAVSPDYQVSGIGRALVNNLEDLVRLHRVNTV